MNTSQIKTFATQSRNILKAGVIQRIQILGFDVDGNLTKGEPTRIEIQGGATLFAGEIYDGAFYDRWMSLRERIREKGVKEVYEEAAYTWFNRLVAIRIMMKNGFIDPVLAYTNEQTRIPRIVAEARAGRVGEMPSYDREKLRELMGDDARINEQFALLIDNFCRNNAVIFNCFGGIEEYISLLLPDNILAPGGFIDLLNHTSYITDEDFKQSELIGWLYQFYISEKKDEVFAKKGKYSSDEIPAATQIFTPNWVVKYMVQNTVGRIYLDNNPWAEDIKESLKYLVEPAVPTSDDTILKLDCLEDYSLLDPACGSGHILIEGFSTFYKMYLSEGYASHNAIENILKKNLLGIDLDTRAKQLATFSLLMTASRIDRSFLDAKVMPRILDMPRIKYSKPLFELLRAFYMGEDRTIIQETIKAFDLLEHSEDLGSIMKFNLSPKTRREMALRYQEWEEAAPDFELLPSIRIVLALTGSYSSVVANPPYMGYGSMNSTLSSYVNEYYSIASPDLCTTFVLKFKEITAPNGLYGFIIPPSWMFTSTFEPFRRNLINGQEFVSFLHLSRGVFGADFGSSSLVLRNATPNDESKGVYFRLVQRTFQEFDQSHLRMLFEEVIANKDFKYVFSSYNKLRPNIVFSENGKKIYYSGVKQKDFLVIPGSPIGYWVSKATMDTFKKTRLGDVSFGKNGITTADNDKFLRFWQEVSWKRISFGRTTQSLKLEDKWIPYNKGGGKRRWYGNQDYLINWEKFGYEIKHFTDASGKKLASVRNESFYFLPCISWSDVRSSGTSFRYFPQGFIFDAASNVAFSYDGTPDTLMHILGVANAKLMDFFADIFNPSIHFKIGNFESTSYPFDHSDISQRVSIVKDCVTISRQDWNAHETSWDFKENELVRVYKENQGEGVWMDANRLEDIVSLYKSYWTEQFNKLHSNEEELNRQFIEIYGLQDELTPEVPLDEITILQQGEISEENHQLVWHNDVLAKQLLSYAIGCMMGRYRLDKPGLHIAYPNPASEDTQAYYFQGEPFEIDDDGIIPLLGRDCPFDDNAYNRVVKFVRQVFGETCLNENLNFIEASLGRTIADYFVKDFWKDHKKMYSNRPIYWLFSSKRGAFQCLTYMHRMNPYTVEAVRSKYLLPYIDFLKGKIAADMERASSLSTVERRNLDKMQTALDECLEYEERLHDVADRQIRFDLDDGVLVNYAKFGDVLAKIK